MPLSSTIRATVDDLYRVEGQAELIGGKIVRLIPMGQKPACAALEISTSLYHFAEENGGGEVFTATLAYIVPELSSGRESFSPDTSFHAGPFPDDPMSFILAPPTFAVEVRIIDDYGEAAEREMAAKRADYFEAGTLVVWDVNPIVECVNAYQASNPEHPRVFRRGEVADAEPAVPGWRMDVDRIFSN